VWSVAQRKLDMLNAVVSWSRFAFRRGTRWRHWNGIARANIASGSTINSASVSCGLPRDLNRSRSRIIT